MGTVLEELKHSFGVTMKELSNLRKIGSLPLMKKKLYAELNGKTQESNEIPDKDQSLVFWSGI